MSSIGALSTQSSALSLLRSGGAGVFQEKKDTAAQTAALLASIEKSGASDGATMLLQKRQQSSSILQQFDSSKSDINEQKKAAAAEKIQRIKQKLSTLRLLAAVNPEAAARQAAQLSRELAQAVREYSSSGGSAAPSAAGTAAVPVTGTSSTQAESGEDKAATAAAVNNAENAETTATSQDGEEGADSTTSETKGETQSVQNAIKEAEERKDKEDNEFRDKIQEKTAAVGEALSSSRADSEFAKQVEDIKNALKRILELTKRKLEEKENDKADQEIQSGENALREVDTLTGNIFSGAIAGLVGGVNIVI